MPRNIGLLGELAVETELVYREWHPVRLDTAQMAANADMIAIKRHKKVSIQVKTTDAITQHTHSKAFGFGRAKAYLNSKFLDDVVPFFNSKESPLIADVIIGVLYNSDNRQFVILPVAMAEKLCRAHADYWYTKPKMDGTTRSPSFPVYLQFDEIRIHHKLHDTMINLNLRRFVDKWDILDLPTDTLHDPKEWIIKQSL